MIIITNKGLVDPMAFHLIGASTKRTDEKTIGFFGSGLKYALAGLIRANIPFQVWRGEELMDITTEEVELRGQKFQRIIIDGVPTSFTTDLGPKWETWMLIRELYANAIDEDGEMAITNDYQEFIKPDRTTIILPEITPELEQVIAEQDILFCRGRDVIYEDDNIKIYDEIGDGGFYVKGILVHRRSTGFGYELKRVPYDLNEERQVRSPLTATSMTLGAIFKINDPQTVRRIISRSRVSGMEREMLRGGYMMSFHAPEQSAEAWHKYLMIPIHKEEFATDNDSFVVSSDVYDHINHPRKWKSVQWVVLEEGKNHLDEALALIECIAPGSVPKGLWRFGIPETKSLFMAVTDDGNFLSNQYIGEPLNRLAAIIALHLAMSSPDTGVRILHNLISK